MKHVARFILVTGLSLTSAGLGNAQQYSIADKPGQSAKIAKQQQKAWTKAAKKQQKAMERNVKAQRKADKKAAQKEAKNHSKQSNRNSRYLP